MLAHRQSTLLTILLLAMLTAPPGLVAMAPTPVSSDTQLYIDHFARFTARVPTAWTVMPGSGAVGGNDGLITGYASSAPTLDAACEEMAGVFVGKPGFTIQDAEWNGDPVCRIEIPNSYINGVPLVVMVVPHPEPFTYQGETFSFAAIAADPDHIDDILETVSFDLTSLSGPEIAHSLIDYVAGLSYHAGALDRDALRLAADTVKSPDQVERFINVSLLPALTRAGDNNAFLIPEPTRAPLEEPLQPITPTSPPTGHLRGNVAYLHIPGTGMPEEDPGYIDASLDQIDTLDSPRTCGWIIDLRGNPGGNLAIILQALTPFFPEGRLLGFVDARGEEIWITREDDEIFYNGWIYGLPDIGPVPELANPDAPVAVLIDEGTASAGEMTLIALMSHPDMRSFGRPTVGALGANLSFPLLDGSTLVFSGGAMLDAQGAIYTTAIEPDEVVISRLIPAGDDAMVLAAEQWLLAHPACQDAATPATLATPVTAATPQD